jgi:hypothetical protein
VVEVVVVVMEVVVITPMEVVMDIAVAEAAAWDGALAGHIGAVDGL